MVKVRIEMDEGWYWYPKFVTQTPEETEEICAEFKHDPDMQTFIRRKETPSMEIPAELLKEYESARDAYHSIQRKFEVLYRKQEGHSLRAEQAEILPEHRMLK